MPRSFPRRRSAVRACLMAALALALPLAAVAQQDNWPTRPIRIITPTTPGSSTDYFPRTLGRYILAKSGQSVVVENKPGGSTVIGAELAKNAAPDGYTFFVSSVSSHSANPALFAKLPYDPARDFVEVGMFSIFPFMAVVHKDSAHKSISDVIAAAKAKPGKLTCGYSTAASRVPCELLKARGGLDIVTVSYKSAPQVLGDLAAGVIDFTILDIMSASAGIKGGLLRPIGVTSPARSPQYPDVKAVAEALPGFEYEGWAGLSAPAGTPPAVLERMSRFVREALAEADFRNGIEQTGAHIRVTTPAEQLDYVIADRKRWKEWVRVANIPPID
ncbi:MAG TPA: tripartite tricarboxylate transporter substrate-binding protein [Ramlibacter sp.]|nr:tripartite tricarboxylate transporter substrate-binding protein [Ramlibacter sp.]